MDTRSKPEPGQTWKHYKGGLYEIQGFATDTETGLEGVIYKSKESGTIYFRILTRFMDMVQPQNIHRFELQ